VGLLIDTTRAVITSLRERANELAATTLLEEALRAINKHAAPHWRASSISELPDMIHELGRDRDDFKTISIAYREELATAEERIRALESRIDKMKAEAIAYYKHEAWCGVFSRCTCADLDEDDP